MELSAEKINGTHTHTHCRHIEIVILLQYFNADRKAANDSKNSKSNHNNNGPQYIHSKLVRQRQGDFYD